MELFGSWLAKTRELQVDAYGQDPCTLRDEELAEFIRWNTLAAQVELAEMLQNLPWKPWAVSRNPDMKEKLKAAEELVDVLHFVGNLFAAIGISDYMLNILYEEKMRVNAERQATGTYTGKDGV
jgi:hypothetical protein